MQNILLHMMTGPLLNSVWHPWITVVSILCYILSPPFVQLKDEKESTHAQEIQELQGSVSAMKDEVRKSHAEVDRLLEIMKEMEGEKNDKEKRIKDLERYIK